MPGVDPTRPGLYEWRIGDLSCYIGKYTGCRRPRREYTANVSRLLAGRHYRKSHPDGFRQVHRSLADAVRQGLPITLTFLENVDPARLADRERTVIRDRIPEQWAGGPRVLNSIAGRIAGVRPVMDETRVPTAVEGVAALEPPSQSDRPAQVLTSLRGRGSSGMTTDEIMAATRGED